MSSGFDGELQGETESYQRMPSKRIGWPGDSAKTAGQPGWRQMKKIPRTAEARKPAEKIPMSRKLGFIRCLLERGMIMAFANIGPYQGN